MIYKEITVRKSNKNTVKTPEGGFISHEADISLTVEAQEGELDIISIIDHVKNLVQITLKDDPQWLEQDRKEENKNG